MCTAGKLFGIVCPKAIRDFLLMCVCDQMRDEVRHEGKGEDSVFGGKT